MFRTIAAFANGSGGTVVIGVDRDEVTVAGVSDEVEVRQLRDDIGRMIHTRVIPMPPFEIKDHVIDGRTVLFIDVAQDRRVRTGS